MRKLLILASFVGVAACAPPGYYVSDIRPIPGGIQVEKCQFDSRGKATTDTCMTQTVIVPALPAAPPDMGPPAEQPRQPAPTPAPAPAPGM